MEFPANTKTAAKKKTASKTEKKAVEPVVSAEVTESKPGIGRRFKDVFLGADFKGASSYIVADVLFPAVRNMVVDATTKGVERFVYGDTAPTSRRQSQRGHTSYRSSSSRHRALPDSPPRRSGPDRPNSNEIILNNREDAEQVLDGLVDMIDQYDIATVADFRELAGLPSSFVDNNWGWTDLGYVEAQQTREGWVINLPNPEPIR